MTSDAFRRETTLLIVLIVISTLALAAISSIGFFTAHNTAVHDHRVLVGVSQNSQLTEQSAARTECIRERSAALDSFRWSKLAGLLKVADRSQIPRIGDEIQALPNILDLANHGGAVGTERFAPCPRPIIKPKVGA